MKPGALLLCHFTGDWGDLDATDKSANERALQGNNPLRIFSSSTLTAVFP